MAKRISDIAKELNVPSKIIIQKCLDEGIPQDKVKGHASVVSAGLEASIKEWFSSGGVATAVETKEHVDVEKVKAKPAPKKKTVKGDPGHVETPHADDAAPSIVDPPTQRPAETPAARTQAPSAPAPVAPTAPAAPAPHHPIAPPPHKPVSISAGPIRLTPHPTPAPTAPGAPSKPTTPPGESNGDGNRAAATAAPVAPGAPSAPHTPHGHRPGPHTPIRTVVKPAPMNVPTRPTHVAPAGQKLEVKQQVKLAGPKVVRIEAPDQVAAPRSRAPGSGPPRGGRGVIGSSTEGGGGGGAGGKDDASRS
ncbi:MAG: hypothetical protein ACREJO_11930, partial [Phycisphaerales bacterium]